MSEQAVAALRVEAETVLGLAGELTVAQWEEPSGCAGWRVQDVLVHFGAAFQLVADPGSMPDPSDSDGMEDAQEVPVRERRDWSPEQVVAAYEEWSAKGIEAMAMIQDPEMAQLPLDMGDLGTHPMHLVANAYAFDHYTHLRFDLAAPSGPLAGLDLPRDEVRLGPTVEWLVAGLAQMGTPDLKPVVNRPFGLRLTGPGGGESSHRSTDTDHAVDTTEGLTGDEAFVATSSTHDFVGWSTTRTPWPQVVEVDGDEAYAASVLDAVNLI
jgi:hypothetical protein